jgi:hypothetical protein
VAHAWHRFNEATLQVHLLEKYRSLLEAENRGIRNLAITAMAHQEQEEAQRESLEAYRTKLAMWEAKRIEADREFSICEQILGPNRIQEAGRRAREAQQLRAKLEECRLFAILDQPFAEAYDWYLELQPAVFALERELERLRERAINSVSRPIFREAYLQRLAEHQEKRPVEPESREHPGPFPVPSEPFGPEPGLARTVRVDAPIASLPKHCKGWFNDTKSEIEAGIATAGDAFTLDQLHEWVENLQQLSREFQGENRPIAAKAVKGVAEGLLEQGLARYQWLTEVQPKVTAYHSIVSAWQGEMTAWYEFEQRRRRFQRELQEWAKREADIEAPSFSTMEEEQQWRASRERQAELREEIRKARELAQRVKQDIRHLTVSLPFHFETWLANP